MRIIPPTTILRNLIDSYKTDRNQFIKTIFAKVKRSDFCNDEGYEIGSYSVYLYALLIQTQSSYKFCLAVGKTHRDPVNRYSERQHRLQNAIEEYTEGTRILYERHINPLSADFAIKIIPFLGIIKSGIVTSAEASALETRCNKIILGMADQFDHIDDVFTRPSADPLDVEPSIEVLLTSRICDLCTDFMKRIQTHNLL